MSKLYTKTGDQGETGLFNGQRVRKDHPRVIAYGTVDELNAQIGLAESVIRSRVDTPGWQTLRERLVAIQSDLFTLGAELATPPDAANRARIPVATAQQSQRLEQWIDEAAVAVAPMQTFILPGGAPAAAHLHVCRTICRRAERDVVHLETGAEINPHVRIYLNRLSDLLFAWARVANHLAGEADVPWVNPAARPDNK